MAISFQCACGKQLRAKDELAGKRAKCPDCSAVVTIPAPDPPPSEPDDLYGLLAEPGAEPSPSEGLPAETDTYGLAGEPDAGQAPAVRPVRFAEEPGSTFRPAPTARADRPSRPVAAPTASGSGATPLEYLYGLLLLALIPLALTVFLKDNRNIKDRLEQTLKKASPDEAQRAIQVIQREGADLDDLLSALPGGKLDEDAHLPRRTFVHWVYALLAAAGFWAFTLSLFPGEKKTPAHLLLVGLFTGTVGIVFLLVVQFLAAATQGVWVRGRGVVLIFFYLAKFIGWSYASADDPDSNFLLSFVGFTCGVGLCEELCKALPLLGYFQRDARMGWRGAAVWGLASGIGFGVSEGVMYSARYYNGIGTAGIYVVRFVSCVALHAIWSASVGITMWRRQQTIQGHLEWGEYALALLRIVAVPMVLHGAYDTLLKKDMDALALGVGVVSFLWFAWQVESARGAAGAFEGGRTARA